MAHYDGPPFLRESNPTPAAGGHQLPPKPQRHKAPETKAPMTPPAKTVDDKRGRHSVDPLAALATPKSVVNWPARKPPLDYRLILSRLQRPDSAVYLFTEDPPVDTDAQVGSEPEETDVAAATPTTDAAAPVDDAAQTPAEDTGAVAPTPPVVEAASEKLADSDEPTPGDEASETPADNDSQSSAAPEAQQTAVAEAPEDQAEAVGANAADSQTEAANDAPVVQTGDDDTDETSAVPADSAEVAPSAPVPTVAPKRPTPLLPSQTDPLKAAQQAQIEAALAKQKKTVYANWRPLKMPDRHSLHSAVGDYKHRRHDKDLPKPVAQRRQEAPSPQTVASFGSEAETTAASARSASPQAESAARASGGAQNPADSGAKPQPLTTASDEVPEGDATFKGAETSAADRPSEAELFAATEEVPVAEEASSTEQSSAYVFPPLDLLPKPVGEISEAQDEWVASQAARLDETLDAFHVGAHVVAHTIGPTVTQFQVSLDAGVKVNKITNLNDDLKLALAAKDIRIEAPIPGTTTVGIEIPNRHPRPVMLREVLQSQAFQEAESPLTIALGVDLFGKPVIGNINKMPHGLIAGATGSGKSVFINSLLTSLLYKATPAQVRLLLIDPKAVELAVYNKLPHLVSPVIDDPKAATAALKWAVDEMEERYQKMAAAGVRNLAQFNQKAKAHGDYGLVMPYIVIIIDELADLMSVAATEIQDSIARITQKARAAGIHMVVATQRPSVDVITGTIKNNIPTRIAFMVASQIDSRTILDTNGAERLLGRGDMLYLGAGDSQPKRLQGAFIDEDIEAVVDFVKNERPPHYLFKPEGLVAKAEAADEEDEKFEQALEYIATQKHVSTSKLQRVLGVGYNRAARLIDSMELHHYISPANGTKPRDVYLTKDDLADK